MTIKDNNSKKQKENTIYTDIQKWLLNIVILCFAVVIIGFMFSSRSRIVNNPDKIGLNRENYISKPIEYIEVVEVLNGCGISGLAGNFAKYIRESGYDVLYIGNADNKDYDSTQIFVKSTNIKLSDPLRKILKMEKIRVKVSNDLSNHFDFRIIIGKDYEELDIYNEIKK